MLYNDANNGNRDRLIDIYIYTTSQTWDFGYTIPCIT